MKCKSSHSWSQFIKISVALIDLMPNTPTGAEPIQEIPLCSCLFIHEQTKNKDTRSVRFVLVCAFS